MLSPVRKYLLVVPPGPLPCGQKWLQKTVSWKTIEIIFLLDNFDFNGINQNANNITKLTCNQMHLIKIISSALCLPGIQPLQCFKKMGDQVCPTGVKFWNFGFFEISNHVQTQILQGCKGGSPSTRIGHNTKLNFYHLKNQIKILPLTICHELCREGGTQVPCS